MDMRKSFRRAEKDRAMVVGGSAIRMGLIAAAIILASGWAQPSSAFAAGDCADTESASALLAPLPAHEVSGFTPEIIARIEMRAALASNLSGLPTSVDKSSNTSFSSFASEQWDVHLWLYSSLNVNWNCYSSQYDDGNGNGGGGGSCNGNWSYVSEFYSDDVCDASSPIPFTGKVLDIYTNENGELVFVTDDESIGEVAVSMGAIQGAGHQKNTWRTLYSLSRGSGKSRNQDATSDFVHGVWNDPYENLYVSQWVGVTVFYPPTPIAPKTATQKLATLAKSQKS